MKKWILSSCLGAALALSMGAVAVAQGQDGNGVGEYCKPLTEELGVSNDLCVTCVNPGHGDFAVCICKNAELNGEEPYLGFPNLGQCVSAVHEAGY